MDNSTCTTESFESWNPLEEAYYNPEFNSYASGPGADLDYNLQIPLKEKVELRSYKLYVKSIPIYLTERGLRNIFTHFGDPKSVCVGRSKVVKNFSWGLVEYDNLLSAQNAIKAIHFQPPYNLNVKFALSEKEKEKRLSEEKKLKEKVCQPQSQSYKEKEDNSNEGRALIISVGLLPQTVSLSTYSNGDGTSTNDYVFDYTFYNHYSRECSCNATHRLYSQLFLNNQMTDYHLTDNSSNTSQLSTPVSLLTCLSKKLDVETETAQIAKPVYDNKNNGVYEYGDEFDNFGKCQLCRATTLSSCKNCQAWYCGTKCLFKHWPEHKKSCSSLNLTNENNIVKNELTLNCRVPLVGVEKRSNLSISEETSSNSFVKPESIIVFLKEGFTGLVQVQERLSDSKLLVTLVCRELSDSHKIFIDVPETIAKFPFDESFIPEVGEVVGLECTQEIGVEWPRGYIYTERQAVLCDFGNVVKYTRVKKLSQQLIVLPSLAVYCTLLEGNKFIQGDDELEFVVTKCNGNGSVEASFKNESNNDFIGKVVFFPLTYFSHVNIKNGSRVRLSAFYNCAAIYVQSDEPESVEVFEELMQDLGAHCQTEKSLNIEPSLGDLVAVQCSKDGNWYRGQLLKKENDDFQVIYVDFGSIETVPLSHMKALTSYLKSIPCCAVRVGLTDIHPDTSLTILALQLLTNLCESSEPLRIEFSNNSLTSVKLLRQGKLSLAEELKILIEPGWKKALERGLDPTGGQVFMMDDLINCLLTEEKEYQLRVLLLNPPKELTLCSTISDLSKHVVSTLSSQLNEYCGALKSTSYNPRNGELCIVQLEEDRCWYRAVCLQTLFTISQARVMFIDFGNICVVSHKNIRRFCEDFISTPAMTIMCNYEGIPEMCTEVVIKRIGELIQPNKEITVLVKSLDEDTFYYNIDIPSVTSVLISEQLL